MILRMQHIQVGKHVEAENEDAVTSSPVLACSGLVLTAQYMCFRTAKLADSLAPRQSRGAGIPDLGHCPPPGQLDAVTGR
ncbi:hypothetical protein RRG08_039279 [Elysia crispata]|uniref:Uncharacterized protein n=1 Tax=Elysia crispata TaxID=231223 RepID=A0AAE0Z7B5_9GAST|nr:hypothetical protein RRG08_039279 [Elysia crispata]